MSDKRWPRFALVVAAAGFALVACGRNLVPECPKGGTDCYGECQVTVVSESTLPTPNPNGDYPATFCPSACRTACDAVCGEDACSVGDAGPRSVNCTRRCLFR